MDERHKELIRAAARYVADEANLSMSDARAAVAFVLARHPEIAEEGDDNGGAWHLHCETCEVLRMLPCWTTLRLHLAVMDLQERIAKLEGAK